jgi:hypothetical protein
LSAADIFGAYCSGFTPAVEITFARRQFVVEELAASSGVLPTGTMPMASSSP